MKKFTIAIFLIIGIIQISAQDKRSFDVDENGFCKTKSLSKTSLVNYKIKNNLLEASMLSGGYFTIGTINGNSDKKLDDLCSITYGHPYALTSFPLFFVDGTWYKLDEFFSSESEIEVQKLGDTLMINSSREGLLRLEFRLFIHADEISISLRMKNLDTATHLLGGGLAFDPSLGRWGDGFVKLSSGFIRNDTTFNLSQQNLTIWEKLSGAKGLGIDLSFSEEVKVIAANWNDVYKNNAPEFTNSELRKIYDLYLKFYFNEKQLQAGEEISNTVTMKLLAPDFSSKLFARWDLPGFISISDGLVFPKNLKTYLEIFNTTGTNINANIQIDMPEVFSSIPGSQNISISANDILYHNVNLTSSIIYENKVAGMKVTLVENDMVVDELLRNIFIPATPVSDTGLVVMVDTIRTSKYPNIDVVFQVKKEENDQFISNLDKDNIFLYENDQRITNFSLGKDTTGGVMAADIIFVLDVTGSMGDEINDVKNNVVEFADSLSAKDIDYRIGIVTFLDEIEGTYPFTKDIQYFQSLVGQQYAHGGGDGPENSLQALYSAAQFDFRPEAKKIFIWITDADYHENDWATTLKKDDVLQALLSKEIVVHAVGSEWHKSSFYDPIINPTGGSYFNINGNFRDALMEISRLRGSNKYLLSYKSPLNNAVVNIVKLAIRFAGLGGENVFSYNQRGLTSAKNNLQFYPNPFNPEITFMINTEDMVKGNVEIYNILGQRIKTFAVENGSSLQKIKWNAHNDTGNPVSAGFYIVKLSLLDNASRQHVESAKILYLK